MTEENPAPAPVPDAPPAQPAEERYPFWGYQDLLLFAGMALPSLVWATVVVKWVVGFVPGGASKAAALLSMQFVAYALWFLCLYAIFQTRYQRPFWQSLAWVRPRRGLWLSIVSGPMVAFGVALLAASLSAPQMETPFRELMSDRKSALLVAAFAVTLGPLCEELAFRGFLFPLLARSLGVVAAIVLAALPFAILHGPQYGWSWRHVLVVTLAGIAFGWTRHRTGSTAAATVMHASYNLTFVVASLLQEEVWMTQW